MTTVRRAGTADLAALLAVRRAWSDGFDPDDPAFGEDFAAEFAAWLAAEGERRLLWLAETSAGRPVGMCSLLEYHRMPAPGRPSRRWGYLGNMLVVAGERDRGIGTALLAAVLAEARARGYVRVVLAPSPRSVPFYRRAGFVDAAEDAGADRLMVAALR